MGYYGALSSESKRRYTQQDGPVHEHRCENSTCQHYKKGRAIAQAVSRWLPTAAARVRFRGLVKWDL
jgi:hypothetical protein